LVPALVSLKIAGNNISGFVNWLTFAISLIVAISVPSRSFFHYGERWRHYRRAVECLKMGGMAILPAGRVL